MPERPGGASRSDRPSAAPYPTRPRRPLRTRLALAALVLLPLLEILAIVAVGRAIGPWPTVAVLVAISLLGAWIVRHAGRRAWRTVRETVDRGLVPDHDIADSALVMLGGILLLVPGFITDVIALACFVPLTRPLLRGLFRPEVTVRMAGVRTTTWRRPDGSRAAGGAGDQIVEGEVVEGGAAGDRADDDDSTPGQITGGAPTP